MMQAAVYDLTTAPPHEPPGARYSSSEFEIYRQGYAEALAMALRVLDGAGRRFELRERTKRLAAKQEKSKK